MTLCLWGVNRSCLKRCKKLSDIKYFYYLRIENKSNKDFAA